MWERKCQGESRMQHLDPRIDFSLIQRKPGIGMMLTILGYKVVLWEGDLLHDKGKMFCYNPKCPCHESRLLMVRVACFVSEGLMTPQEATNLVAGKHF